MRIEIGLCLSGSVGPPFSDQLSSYPLLELAFGARFWISLTFERRPGRRTSRLAGDVNVASEKRSLADFVKSAAFVRNRFHSFNHQYLLNENKSAPASAREHTQSPNNLKRARRINRLRRLNPVAGFRPVNRTHTTTGTRPV